MARLLVLDDPDQLREGRRVRGMVVSVLPDGQSLGAMEAAQFLVLDVPDLTVSDAQATYLQIGPTRLDGSLMWRSKRISLTTLASLVSGLAVRRTYLANTLSSHKTLRGEQDGVKAARIAAFKTRLQAAFEGTAGTATESGITAVVDDSTLGEAARAAVDVLHAARIRGLLTTRAMTPLSVTAAQLAVATVDVA